MYRLALNLAKNRTTKITSQCKPVENENASGTLSRQWHSVRMEITFGVCKR